MHFGIFSLYNKNYKGSLALSIVIKPGPGRIGEVKYMTFEIRKRAIFNVFRIFLWFNEIDRTRPNVICDNPKGRPNG